MALSPSAISIYNGQASGFSCPYVEGAVQWEWWADSAAASVSPNGQSASVTAVNWTGSDISGVTVYCNAKNEFNQTLAQHQGMFTARTCPATGISVSPASIALTYDNQFGYMTGTLTSNQGWGAQVSLPGVNYSSSNNSICAVGSSGLLNAEGNGIVNVWVSANNYAVSGYCQVTVTGFPPPNIPVTGVTISKTATSLSVGSSEQLTKTINPSNATNQNVTWSSNNTSVATVDSNGYITAVGVGVTNVKVTTQDGGYQALCTVTVTSPSVPVTGVSLNYSELSLGIGAQATLSATVYPSNASNKSVYWTTGNANVATVSNGVVTAVGAGNCYIIVTTYDGGFQAMCYITVTPARPSNWAWSYPMVQYGAVRRTTVSGGVITAYIVTPEEWNAYTTRVNDFRRYKGLANYNFTTVGYDTIFTPAIYNEVVNAMAPIASGLSTAYGGGITAEQMNALKNVLNSIT